MKKLESAGGVLYRINNSVIEIFLITHEKDGYMLPKGTRETNEEWEETAEREILEETGYDVKNGKYIDSTHYIFSREKIVYSKIVKYFAFEVSLNAIKHDLKLDLYEAITGGKWLEINKAIELVKYDSSKEVLRKFKEFIKN